MKVLHLIMVLAEIHILQLILACQANMLALLLLTRMAQNGLGQMEMED